MNFGDALCALKDGRMVQRTGWNGKGMFLYLVEGSMVPVEMLRGSCYDAVKFTGALEGAHQEICWHIDMKAADGSIVIGWLASQTDMLAEDWQVVE